MKKLNFLLLLTVMICSANAQQGVAINGNGAVPDSKSILDISSTSKGVLIPRMTAIQRIAIAPTATQKGMLVFDIDSSAFIFWTGAAWQKINGTNNPGGAGFWSGGGNDIYNSNIGNVGIGVNSLKAGLHVAADRNVLFGNDTSGAGAKLLWIPSKRAFRAGVAGPVYNFENDTFYDFGDSTAWNYDSIGHFSFAGGFSNKAKGNSSTAFGAYNESMGEISMALGLGNKAIGNYSFAAGSNNYSTGIYSTAMGNENKSTAAYSFASGYNSEARGTASFTTGYLNKATGNYSTATGLTNIAKAAASSVFGWGNRANAFSSTVIGAFNDSIAGSNSLFWVSADPLFVIGNGTDDTHRKNAFTVFKNGRASMGTNAPSGLLHIRYNSSTADPQLVIEESTTDYSRISFKNGNLGYWNIGAYTNHPSEFTLFARMNFAFSATGNILSLRGNGDATLAGVLTQFSDERLKQNIHPLKNTLEKVMQLKGYTYQWKDPSKGNDVQIGFLAQEIEKQFPQLVSTDEKGMKSVAYSNMVPVLLQAIKEQQQQIDELKKLIMEKVK